MSSSTSRASSVERKSKITKALEKIRRTSKSENLDNIDPMEGPSNKKDQLPEWDFSSENENDTREEKKEEEREEKRRKKGKHVGKSKKGKEKMRKVKRDNTESEESEYDSDSPPMTPTSQSHDPLHVSFTKANPLGQVLLKLLADNLTLQERVGITESSISARDLCKAFHMQMQNERKLIKTELEQAAQITEERIISREFDALCTNDEAMPSYFSKQSKLISNAANVEAQKLFPTKNKFSGGNHDSLSLQEFFHNLRIAQEQMRLTEAEFLKMMLLCTSGRANELLTQWVDQNERVSEIYFNLTLHFDKRMTTESARQKLLTIMAPKSGDLARHISHVMSLAQRAASAIPAGASRTAYFNNEAISALMRSLPPASRTTCSNLFHTLSAKARRAITYNELTRPLITLRDTIDADIKANGVGSSVSANAKVDERRKFAKKTGSSNKKPTSFVVEASYENPTAGGSKSNRRYYKKPGNFTQPHVYLAAGSNSAPRTNSANPNRQRQPFRAAGPSNRRPNQYCSLCGKASHTAAQGCANMRDAQNKIVNVQPTQSTCNVCPGFVNPRLNHPAVFCPYRPNGPFQHHTK